ncbi:hypothetical protein [Escherichia coli]
MYAAGNSGDLQVTMRLTAARRFLPIRQSRFCNVKAVPFHYGRP